MSSDGAQDGRRWCERSHDQLFREAREVCQVGRSPASTQGKGHGCSERTRARRDQARGGTPREAKDYGQVQVDEASNRQLPPQLQYEFDGESLYVPEALHEQTDAHANDTELGAW